MADLRIVDAPLLSTVKGTEKLPTGGEGNFSVSVNQVADFAKLKWFLATEGYVDNVVGNVQSDLNLHKNNANNPHQVTKEQVGLGNVDNTADLDKPVSNATQSAIITANSGKADKSYVDSQDQLKADKNTVEASLLLKADRIDLKASKIVSDSGQTQQSVNDFGGARWYEKSGGYELGATVKLANGDIVKSTVANNIINPNVDMTGWEQPDSVNSVTSLRLRTPSFKGQRLMLNSYHDGIWLGGGHVVATQKSGLIDNGVTIFSSPNPLIFWVRSGIREVTPFMAGAKGDRVQDDQPAFMAALATGFPVKAEKPPVGYRLNAPVSLSDAQVLEGDKERIIVYVDHVGACFKLTKNCTLKNFSPRPFNSAREYNFDGLEVGESGSSVSFTFNNIDNIKPFFPRNGFVLRGWVFWNTFLNIDCYKFRDNGILLANDTEDKNNNYFQFKQLSSNAQVESDGSYKFLDVTWEQCAIRVKGHQNIFVGGEHAPSKWGVWIDGTSSGNRFQTMYGEHQLHPIKTFAGSENFYDSTCAQGTPQIHPDSIIYGQSGKDNTRYARLGIAPIAAQKDLKGLWFFNEGFGTKIIDHSGNKKHLTAINPNWTNEGRWGKTVKLDAARTSRFADFPVDVLNWEQPFTLAACVKSPEAGANFLITFRDVNQRYAAITTSESRASITDYDLTKFTTTSYTRMLRSPQDGYVWVIMHFDPVNKTITTLDPERGVVDPKTPEPPVFSPWLAGGGAGISTITLGSRTTAGLDGSFSFLGLWQRRLNMSEVSDLVNMKVPNLFPSAAPARISNQADSAAADLAALKADFNALLLKMRESGIML